MKLQELNQNELQEINGGGLLSGLLGGGSGSSSGSGTLLGVLSIGSLLSLTNDVSGDDSIKTSLSIGNGIKLDLGAMLQNLGL